MTFLIFGGNISCVKLLVDPVWEYLEEILFDDPEIDNYEEQTSTPGEEFSCFYVYNMGL